MISDSKTKTVRLGDVAEVIPGYAFKSTDFVTAPGVPVIKIKNITGDYGVSLDFVVYVPESLITPRLEKFIIKKDDYLVAMTGATAGKVGRMLSETRAVLNQRVAKIKPKNIDKEYLWFLIAREDFTQKLYRLADGAAQPNMSGSQIENVLFEILPLESQGKVADILLSLDRKIELNRKTNKTLEEMGQALFKHYFIQNPDAKNWPLVNFGSVVDVVGGGTPSTKESKFWDGDIPWTSPRDLTGHDEVYLLKTDKTISELGLKKISSGLLPEGTLLMSSRAPIGYVAISATEIAINQGYIAFRSGGTFSNNFMFFWLKQNMNLIKNAANGSTFMEISKTVFRSIEIRKPSEQVLINFEKQSEILFENIKNLQYQSQNLLELRDLFLPRLMSGKISL